MGFMDKTMEMYRSWHAVVRWGLPVALVLVIASLIPSGGSSKDPAGAPTPATAPAVQEVADAPPTKVQHTETPKPKPLSKRAQAKANLEDKFGDRLSETDDSYGFIATIKANDNFTNGMIRSAIRADAKDAFEAIHNAYTPRQMQIEFTFPLVDKATGEQCDCVVTTYRMTKEQAKAIIWDNADEIDWDTYRVAIHPAIQ